MTAMLTSLDQLEPLNYGDIHIEAPATYLQRVPPLVPNIPDCVLEQWLHRHWACVLGTWAWLSLPALRFAREEWTSDQIWHQVKSTNEEAVEGWSQQFRNSRQFRASHVGKFMLEHGTWETPVIVVPTTTT